LIYRELGEGDVFFSPIRDRDGVFLKREIRDRNGKSFRPVPSPSPLGD